MVDSVSGSGLGGASRTLAAAPAAREGSVSRQQLRADFGWPRAQLDGADAVRSMAAEAPVDGSRVAELKAAIDSGSYRVDPELIAAAMIRSELGGLK